jgi:hypothetical protein
VIRDASRHRRSALGRGAVVVLDRERLVDPRKVVVHVVQADGMGQVLDDARRAYVLKSYLTTINGIVRLASRAGVATGTVEDYSDYYAGHSRCRSPNCGDPKTYPPLQGTGPPGGCAPSPPNYPCGDGCCNGDFGVCCGCSRVFQGPTCIKPESCANC